MLDIFIIAVIINDVSEQQRQWECGVLRGRVPATQTLRDGEFSFCSYDSPGEKGKAQEANLPRMFFSTIAVVTEWLWLCCGSLRAGSVCNSETVSPYPAHPVSACADLGGVPACGVPGCHCVLCADMRNKDR